MREPPLGPPQTLAEGTTKPPQGNLPAGIAECVIPRRVSQLSAAVAANTERAPSRVGGRGDRRQAQVKERASVRICCRNRLNGREGREREGHEWEKDNGGKGKDRIWGEGKARNQKRSVGE